MFIGLLLGIISGVLPGIGNASIMLLVLPVIIKFDPVNLFICFLSIVISSQYVASVTAIYTGIPGAESAIPTSREFPGIHRFGLMRVAIKQNASASLIGNLIGLFLFFIIFPFLDDFVLIYKNSLKVGILIFAYLAITYISKNRLVAIVSILMGSFLMTLGFNLHTFETFNLGLPILNNGLDWVSLIMGALMGSAFYSLENSTASPITQRKEDILEGSKIGSSVFRGGILGFLIGFVPGLSYILSSNITYLMESKRQLRKKVKEPIRILNSIAASESAHSSGTLAMLVPLLIFGLPITASEAVILNLITINSSLSDIITVLTSNLPSLAFVIIVINLVSFWIALKGRVLVRLMLKVPLAVLRYVLFVLGFITIAFASENNLCLDIGTYLLCFFTFSRKDIDPLAFVMAVLLYHHMYNALYLFGELS